MQRANSFGDQLLEIKTFIDHGTFMPEIIDKLSPYGFGPEAMIKGRNLLDATHAEHELHNRFNRERLITCDKFTMKFNEIYEEYARHRGRAKVAFRSQKTTLCDILAVYEEKPVRYSDWIIFATRFYTNALSTPRIIYKFAKVLIFEDELRKMLLEIEELEILRQKQEYEQNQANYHTEVRVAKFSELKEWYNEALAIARIALKETPNLLEALGIELEQKI